MKSKQTRTIIGESVSTGWAALPGNEHFRRAAEIAVAGNFKIMTLGLPELLDLARDTAAAIGAEIECVPPCGCGNFMDYALPCECKLTRLEKHLLALRAMAERFDMIVEITRVEIHKVLCPNIEPLEIIKARVENCGAIPESINDDSIKLLDSAVHKFHFMPEAIRRIVKVAGVVAALAGRNQIGCGDMAEAIQYRTRCLCIYHDLRERR